MIRIRPSLQLCCDDLTLGPVKEYLLLQSIRSRGPRCRSSVFSSLAPGRLNSSSGTASSTASQTAQINPPRKKYRDSTSVLRSLASCVQPCAEAVDFRLSSDPWLCSPFNFRTYVLAKAKGRMAARLAVRDYFPNDLMAISKEIPRIDRLLPLITPNEVLKRMTDGELTATQAMDRLIMLLAPQHAWKLYDKLAPDEPWTDDTLHRLLDLLCATNNGMGRGHIFPLHADLTDLPDPDDIYFMDEVVAFHNKRPSIDKTPLISPTLPEVTAEASQSVEPSENEVVDEPVIEAQLESPPPPSIGSDQWSLHGPAELLFNKELTRFQTPAAYSSMIRGAARFHQPSRALELFNHASDAPNPVRIDLTTYSALLRCLHELDPPDCWPIVQTVVNRFHETRQAPTVAFFSSLTFTVAKAITAMFKTDNPAYHSDEKVGQYVSTNLGLLSEMRQIGLEPSLGVMANVLLAAQSAKSSSSQNSRGYACAELLSSFLDDVENRFAQKAPSRLDQWTVDDLTFFSIAMQIALNSHSLELGERINKLLTASEDRQFFLASSQQKRTYTVAYALLLMSSRIDHNTALPIAQRLHSLYRTHRDTILTTAKPLNRIIDQLTQILSISGTGSVTCDKAKHIAYACLCHIASDVLDQTRVSLDFHQRQGMPILIQTLTESATVDPWAALQTSMNILTRLKRVVEVIAYSPQRLSTVRSTASSDAPFIQQAIRMAFPAASEVVRSRPIGSTGAHQLQMKRVTDTLSEWLLFGIQQKAILWTWTPVVVGFLWQHGDEPSELHLWDLLRQLSAQSFQPSDVNEAKQAADGLRTVLETQERVLTQSSLNQVLVEQNKSVLERVQSILHDALVHASHQEQSSTLMDEDSRIKSSASGN